VNERYSHQFHAGNVGDVWKHTVLTALVAALVRSGKRLHVVETHAGAGRYVLGPTGEWTEGIGKLWAAPPPAPEAITRFLGLVPVSPTRLYPGSPQLTLALLGRDDRASFFELERDTCDQLLTTVAGDPRAEVHLGDGLAALPEVLRGAPADEELLVVIDPPYSLKEDWNTIPAALVAAHAQRPNTRFLLWYALKSYTRPNAMLQRLAKTELTGVTLELITTPLELQKNRLNGSGVLLVNAPEEVIVEASAAAPVLGRLCATHAGRFTVRSVAWAEPWLR
jgi:23S rRNA (adenine2030-N6)-methyltransferase